MRALPLLSQAVDRDHEADARLVLTRTLVGLGRAEEARPHVARAIALAEELADAWRLGRRLGLARPGRGGARAMPRWRFERFSDAQVLFEQQGRAAEAAWMETVSGSTLILMGRPDLALARFEEAARLHEHLEDGGVARRGPRGDRRPAPRSRPARRGPRRRPGRPSRRPGTPTTGPARSRPGSGSPRSRAAGATGRPPPRPSTRPSTWSARWPGTTRPSRSGSSSPPPRPTAGPATSPGQAGSTGSKPPAIAPPRTSPSLGALEAGRRPTALADRGPVADEVDADPRLGAGSPTPTPD